MIDGQGYVDSGTETMVRLVRVFQDHQQRFTIPYNDQLNTVA